MNIAPQLARDIYAEQVNEKGKIVWSESNEERSKLARALFGKQLISTFDYWFNHAVDLLENPQPQEAFPRKNDFYKRDKYFRDRLSTLSEEQKQAVRNLVREVAHGILFGTLVDVDQSHYGEIEIAIKLNEEDGQSVKIAPDKSIELHDELNDWVISFSKFADEIAELVETEHGWGLRLKKFY